MVRTVNEEVHAQRRNAILDVAQRAVITKGYEQMVIADILSELQISSGAFYHYFDSKPALLFTLVERMRDEIEQVVLPSYMIPSLELWRSSSVSLPHSISHKHLILACLPVWHGDGNTIVRHKLYQNRIKRLTP